MDTLTLIGKGRTVVTRWGLVDTITVIWRDDGEGYSVRIKQKNGDLNEIDHVTPEQMEVNIERLQKYGAEGFFLGEV